MALSKSIDTPTGVAATYHRITQASVAFPDGPTVLLLESYLDASARASGKQPLQSSTLTVEGMPTWSGDPRPWAYAQFVAREEWAGAETI